VEPLKVCFLASEVSPFAKTGGLADVSSALPRSLWEGGHDVHLFVPLYSATDLHDQVTHVVDFLRDVPIEMDDRTFRFSAVTAALPGTTFWIYLIDCPELYDRPAIYGAEDDDVRFAFFCRAVLECCQRMKWSPDVIHCNDWHTALVPLYLKTLYAWDRLFVESRTVLTIHNLAYQGIFGVESIARTGLAGNEAHLDAADLAAGRVNFLKTGIVHTDIVTTVSRTYAREIRGEEFGEGLDGLLRERSDSLVGILNGVDYGEWNPETDRFIPHNYTAQDLEGKSRNRDELLGRFELDGDPDGPVLGIVSRLAPQKGFDLFFPSVLPGVLEASDARLVVLGTGEEGYETEFRGLRDRFPGKVGFHNGYSEDLAHLIEAGADVFLMPSRFEPCGLNQMYSLKYGTVPVVRRTGGLADTVRSWEPRTGKGTGFLFDAFTPAALEGALDRMLASWRDQDGWRRLMLNGMRCDYSWRAQSVIYVDLYSRLVEGWSVV
jgi:starch synthase